jgi:hypothetical protein
MLNKVNTHINLSVSLRWHSGKHRAPEWPKESRSTHTTQPNLKVTSVMARRRTLPSPADRGAQFTRLEIYREICKLRRRIEEVNALDTKQIRYGDMKINAVETNGRNQGRESRATFRSVTDAQKPWKAHRCQSDGEQESECNVFRV